ncbi:MAG TPA: hypothetical protein VGX52_11355 [Burkholderiales bacterium]|nr:hypothetical protein [Burkholderiales bacterium]
MKPTILTIATALAFGLLAGCDRNPEQRTTATPPAAPAGSGASTAPSNTPSTPANAGTPSETEKKSGSNPVQGQVDPKQPAQQKDFKQGGDGAGPKPGG